MEFEQLYSKWTREQPIWRVKQRISKLSTLRGTSGIQSVFNNTSLSEEKEQNQESGITVKNMF